MSRGVLCYITQVLSIIRSYSDLVLFVISLCTFIAEAEAACKVLSHQTVSSHTNIHLLDFLSWLELLGFDKLKRYSSYVSKIVIILLCVYVKVLNVEVRSYSVTLGFSKSTNLTVGFSHLIQIVRT